MKHSLHRALIGSISCLAVVLSSSVVRSAPEDSPAVAISAEISRATEPNSLLAKLSGAHGDPGRIPAKAGEKFRVKLAAQGAAAARPLRLGTSDGGVINGRPGDLKRARAGTDPLEVTFEVGTEPGVYRLRIDHHGESQSIEFWVGPESPQGRPGPKRRFTAPSSTAR